MKQFFSLRLVPSAIFCVIVVILYMLVAYGDSVYPILVTNLAISEKSYVNGTNISTKYSTAQRITYIQTMSFVSTVSVSTKSNRNIENVHSNRSVPSLTDDELKQIKRTWYNSPIVVMKYKLIFFWNEKSGCSYWKSLLQFIQGLKHDDMHNPSVNGLQYLINFKDRDIVSMMYNDSWTKAVFVREPRERILSCYLDKGLNNGFMMVNFKRTVKTFSEFLELAKQCYNAHWESQVRAPKYFYKNMMIGKMTNMSTFTEKLLTKIGAWNDTVKNWLDSKESEKKSRSHAQNAGDKLLQYYNDTKFQDVIFEMFEDDYDVFNFERKYFDFNKNGEKTLNTEYS
ncbi:carbohydrate sulfotransferase 9-like [Mytilus californianus]|uniref:carbohydrate sulfotransferase 9-like n=1 Tax=Mytilus californianus TaxID=6549 RepID=UPI002245CCE9|nr:carbohydrate sulfotransferase 9-like [Mytilus californianus]